MKFNSSQKVKTNEIELDGDFKNKINKQYKVIGDYFELQRGITYKSALLGQEGSLLLGLATIERHGGFRKDSLQTYGGESPKKLIVNPGEVYVALKDVTQAAELLGAIARLPPNYGIGRLTQDTVKLIPKNNSVPIDYLYWVMRTPHYRSYCKAFSTGTTNLGLSREDFLSYPAPYPNNTQQKIVNLLNVLEKKSELLTTVNEKLLELNYTMFKSQFIHFNNITEFEESKSVRIPKGWKQGYLGDNILTKKLSSGISNFTGTKRYLDTSSVDNTSIIKIGEEITFEYRPSRANMQPKVNTVWFAKMKDSKKVLFFDSYSKHYFEKFILSTGFAGLEVKPFALYYIISIISSDYFEKFKGNYCNGTTMEAINNQGISEINILNPPESILLKFNNFAKPIFKKIYQNNEEIIHLLKIRDILLSKLQSVDGQ